MLPLSPLYPPHLNVVGVGWVECQAVAKKKSVLAGVRVPVSPDNIELGGDGGAMANYDGVSADFFFANTGMNYNDLPSTISLT